MVFALTPAAQRHLGLQFEKRQTRKTYVARVQGRIAEKTLASLLAASPPDGSAFAVAEIQDRLPNCGICNGRGVTLTRKFREVQDRTVTGLTRHLFTINWANSAPGISWPVRYTLVWIPVFDRFVAVASADGTDAFGYADFALGHFPAGGDWVAQVKEIVVRDWRAALDEWNQSAWAHLFDWGVVSEDAALAWRREVWAGSEWWDEPDPEEEELEEEEEEEDVTAEGADEEVAS